MKEKIVIIKINILVLTEDILKLHRHNKHYTEQINDYETEHPVTLS